jgi:Trk K+ transport system NAD-binding subunit
MWAGVLIPSLLTALLVSGHYYIKERIMQGKLALHLKKHTVILGNRDQETVDLVEFLKNDKEASQQRIVLCSFRTRENPFPEDVDFVHGDLHSDDVMGRACIATADRIIIHADTDEKSILIAIAVNHYNPTAIKVVNLDDPTNEESLNRIGVGSKFACIKPMNVALMAREIINPGISRALTSLLGNSGQEFYSLAVPHGKPATKFGDIAAYLQSAHQVLLYAVAPDTQHDAEPLVNPGKDFIVLPGMNLFYIAADRLDPQSVWTS